MKRPNIILLSDEQYRDDALENFFAKHRHSYSDLSLVDEIIKLILLDKNVKIDYIVSFDVALQNEALSLGIKPIM